MLYFDHSATTPPLPEVIAAVEETMKDYYGNPSSIHRLGVEAEKLLRKAREVCAAALQAEADELVFTSGGTESNNLAIKGAAFRYRQRGMHLITSATEHPSVLECCRQLEQHGFKITCLPVDCNGAVRLEQLAAAMTSETIVVSIMHVNNETGTIQPIAEIGQLLKRYPRTVFHVDAVQSFGKLPVCPQRLGIDLLTVSAHKFGGPRGSGLLYARRGIVLEPLLAGGGQERGLRAGTENVPALVGMAKAMRMAAERQGSAFAYIASLRKQLVDRLAATEGAVYNGSEHEASMAPHIVNVSFPGIRPEVVIHALERKQIYISTKSACASGKDKPSEVLLAMGKDRATAASGLRISLSAAHTGQQIDTLACALEQAVAEQRRAAGGGRTR